jgi:hypothetical protein
MNLIRRSNGARVHIACVDDAGSLVDPADLAADFAPWAPEPRIDGD